MKIGRNEPCHCGSGEKYKRCCLEADWAARETAGHPFVRARPMGNGLVEIILPTTELLPPELHENCPICQATTPAERMRLIREHSVVPWN